MDEPPCRDSPGVGGQRAAAEQHLVRRAPDNARQRPQQRRLPDAVETGDADHFARADIKINV